MKICCRSIIATIVCAFTLQAFSQAPVITSFSRNGLLVCTNLMPGSQATVQQGSSLDDPSGWQNLQSVTVEQNGTIQVSVPMAYTVPTFFRVRGTIPPPQNMALIPAGSFTMGDNLDGSISALPLHTVYVSAFYMGKYEVTKALWDEVYSWAIAHGYTFDYSFSGQGKAANHPAQVMTWYDAVKWCNARSEKEGRTPAYYTDAGLSVRYRSGQVAPYVNWATGYRLPTEAEWEKAARGGASGRRFPWSDADTITHSQANYYSSGSYAYDTSSTGGLHPTFYTGFPPSTGPVGYFAPNGYGLYDMAGNVGEWCWDWFGLYSSASQSDPRGPATGSYRVKRGGGWYNFAANCRTADRSGFYPTNCVHYVGFRAALPPGQ